MYSLCVIYFYQPQSVAVDSTGNMYIYDSNNNRVLRWLIGASKGTLVAGEHDFVKEVCSERNRSSLVCTWREIHAVDPNRNDAIPFSHSSFQWKAFNTPSPPRPLVVWPVRLIEAWLWTWIGNGLTGITLNNIASAYDAQVDTDGRIYVPDFTNGRVLKWSPPSASGTLVAGQISSPGSSASQLKQPTQVIIDSTSTVYICDYGKYLLSIHCRSLVT